MNSGRGEIMETIHNVGLYFVPVCVGLFVLGVVILWIDNSNHPEFVTLVGGCLCLGSFVALAVRYRQWA